MYLMLNIRSWQGDYAIKVFTSLIQGLHVYNAYDLYYYLNTPFLRFVRVLVNTKHYTTNRVTVCTYLLYRLYARLIHIDTYCNYVYLHRYNFPILFVFYITPRDGHLPERSRKFIVYTIHTPFLVYTTLVMFKYKKQKKDFNICIRCTPIDQLPFLYEKPRIS